jgi:hypothetical protein
MFKFIKELENEFHDFHEIMFPSAKCLQLKVQDDKKEMKV